MSDGTEAYVMVGFRLVGLPSLVAGLGIRHMQIFFSDDFTAHTISFNPENKDEQIVLWLCEKLSKKRQDVLAWRHLYPNDPHAQTETFLPTSTSRKPASSV